jgi:nucleotide-binding universal stress UspA family protein
VERRNEIVVGVDGSPAGDAAVRWAATEARRRGAALRLVHVCEENVALSVVPAWLISSVLRQIARPTVRAARRRALGVAGDVPIRTEVRIGSAARALLDAAEHAAMLVVGRTGRGSLPEFLPGSVPSRLAASAECSLVTVPAPSARAHTPGGGRVVLPVDIPRLRGDQLWFALDEAHHRSAELLVLHAQGGSQPSVGLPWRELFLQETARLRGEHSIVQVEVVEHPGTLGEAIADLVGPDDFLVLGRHRPRAAVRPPGDTLRAALDVAHCPTAVVAESSGRTRSALLRAVH